MTKRYGVPYTGSKNKLAPKVVGLLPSATTLYDVFAGGCAITHAAMEAGKYTRYVANDYDEGGITLFARAVNGCYHDERQWVSREDFEAYNDVDPYIRLCWSFGNNAREYMYGRHIEPWKKALHYARVLGDYSLLEEIGVHITDASRMAIKARCKEITDIYRRWWARTYLGQDYDTALERIKREYDRQCEELRRYLCEALRASGLTQREVGRRLGTQMEGHYFGRSQWEFPTREHYERMRGFLPLARSYDECTELIGMRISLERLERLEILQRLESLQSLESLERLQSLESLERLERLETSSKDYKDVRITEADAVVYCDPPYVNTQGYEEAIERSGFNHEEFYQWCERQAALVVVSEYSMPPDRFTEIASMHHTSAAHAQGSTAVTERLFVVKGREDEYCRRMEEDRRQPSFFAV